VVIFSAIGEPLAVISLPGFPTALECVDAQTRLNWYDRTRRWPQGLRTDCIPRLKKPGADAQLP